MSADEKELLKEAQIKVHDLTLDEATRYRYQAIEKYIMEKNTVLKEREIAFEEREGTAGEGDCISETGTVRAADRAEFSDNKTAATGDRTSECANEQKIEWKLNWAALFKATTWEEF